MRDLYGAMTRERAGKGFLVTTSDFTRHARSYLLDGGIKTMELWSAEDLLAQLELHGERMQRSLRERDVVGAHAPSVGVVEAAVKAAPAALRTPGVIHPVREALASMRSDPARNSRRDAPPHLNAAAAQAKEASTREDIRSSHPCVLIPERGCAGAETGPDGI